MNTTTRPLILGVIGSDMHMVGSRVLEHVLKEAGFNVIHLGGFVLPEEFIRAAIEANAAAILITSLSGYGEMYVRDFRKKCDEAGLKDIKLCMGGHIVMGQDYDWAEVEARFKGMGFDRVTPPGISAREVIEILREDLAEGKGTVS